MADETTCTVSSAEETNPEKEYVGTITTTVRATSKGVSGSTDLDGDFSQQSALAGIAMTIIHTAKIINMPLEQAVAIIVQSIASVKAELTENDSTASE